MIDGVRIKVCGLTSLVDAEFADKAGADYLGFILYPKSPRYVPLVQASAMSSLLPDRKRVAVSVEPALDDLKAQIEAGFDFFQIHFRNDLPLEQVTAWSDLISRDKLWLVPKLPPEVQINPAHVALAKTILFDTYQPKGFGGSGLTGDWEKFARSKAAHPGTTWILSGGLSPDNIAEALTRSQARYVDVNSGVEASPGVKDHAKLKNFIVRLHEARTKDC